MAPISGPIREPGNMPTIEAVASVAADPVVREIYLGGDETC
jgi:hypothetical protein